MQQALDALIVFLAFGLVALAASRVGGLCARIRLPFITGFLLTGILAGPYALDMISEGAVENLFFVNSIALSVIAFAAGSELHFEEVRSRLPSILRVTLGLVISTFTIGSLTFWFLAREVPFDEYPSPAELVAIACVAGSILVARSPSSAIAIVRELRARGPLTQMVLGVTVIMDVLVIVLFSVCSEIAGAVSADLGFDLFFIVLLAAEIVGSILAGLALWKLLALVLAVRTSQLVKTTWILLLGWGVFAFSDWLREFTHEHGPFEVLVEPLLVCVVGSLLVTNRSPYRAEFARILHDVGPPVYTAFFVLTGASLDLDVLAGAWAIALALFLVRLVSIFLGSFTGGLLAGDPPRIVSVSWMGFVTQAGVGIGLAREMATEFPQWGESVATISIAVIVINQLVGPPLFKWAIGLARESRVRAEGREFDGVRDTLIFGSGGGQSLTLARQLIAHGWKARVVIRRSESSEGMSASDVEIIEVQDLSLATLKSIGAADVDAVVALLSDAENLALCEAIYEHFGTETVVVRLHDREYLGRFRELGVLVIDPSTAMISLLEHLVRSPTATALLLGTEPDQDVVDIEVRNPDLDGVPLRSLSLPLDTLVLSVHREGHTLISHGYTRLRVGDRVTVLGAPKDLDEVSYLFDG